MKFKHLASGAVLLLLSSLSFAQVLAWKPQYESFNQLGCESEMKSNMVAGEPMKMTSTGSLNIDRYIAIVNHKLELPDPLPKMEYSWEVDPHQHGPSSLNVDRYFSANGANFDVGQTLSQPRLPKYNFSFTNDIVFWNNTRRTLVAQTWDIDKDCKLHLLDTTVNLAFIKQSRILIWQDTLQRGSSVGAIHRITISKPTDGPVTLDENYLSLPQIEKQIKSEKVFYSIGGYSMPLIKLSQFSTSEGEVFDPIKDADERGEFVKASVQVGKDRVVLTKAFSTASRFSMESVDNSPTWYLPLNLWLTGHIPQPNFSDDGQAVNYGNGAIDGEEPVTIIFNTNVSEFSRYDHFGLYWKIERTSGADGNAIYTLDGGGTVRLANYADYPRWVAPANSNFPDFVKGTDLVQVGLPYVKEAAESILHRVGESASDAVIAEHIISFLHNHFHYNYGALDLGGQITYMNTAQIINHKYITCTNFSNLFAAIARSLGIPTRIVVGAYIGDTIGYHAWNEIEIAKNKWLPVDPTGNDPAFFKGFYVPFTAAIGDVLSPNDSFYTDALPDMAGFFADKATYSAQVVSTESFHP